MNLRYAFTLAAVVTLGTVATARAEKFYLLNGVDALHYPGVERYILGPGSVPGAVYDGDRLAGTSDIGPVVPFVGTGTPMYQPNHLGSLSMLYRRGTIPYAGGVPILGIEFLGGPLLDLDGDLNNGQRSLIPVIGATPVEIPGTDSFIELEPNVAAGTIGLGDFDSTGCNEGGPNLGPDITTILVTIAGTQPDGSKTGAINTGVDTRAGSLTAYTGTSGTLAGVYRVTDLGFELWEDSIDPFTSSPDVLGTMQFLGTLQGWLIQRDQSTGEYPTLAGEGLGSTRWPEVDTAQIGQSFNTANGLSGGTATILGSVSGDNYTFIDPNNGNVDGNGGLPLADFGGDLGAYLDNVVIPLLPATADRVVYLESAGFGINNSMDPVYTDTVGYDVVMLAATGCAPYVAGDTNCDGAISFADINPFVDALVSGRAAWAADVGEAPCSFVCVNDINHDGVVGFADINPFVDLLLGNQ